MTTKAKESDDRNGRNSKNSAQSQRPTKADSRPPARPEASTGQIVLVPVECVDPNPFQPRQVFDREELEELTASIRSHGVLQPVTVRTAKTQPSDGSNGVAQENGRSGNGLRYNLVSGERRLRAAKDAGKKTIPAIIRDDLSDAAVAELALVENIQRSNLNIIEEATGYKRLMVQFRMKEERIAKKVGKSVATIREMIKLLALPEPVQQLLANRTLTAAHGQQLLRLAAFKPVCELVAQKAVQDHLTATSLSTTLLPNAQQLKARGFVVELDYKTQFDWREECGQCPHDAYIRSGYSSYCLRPEEWKKKNDAAIELKQQEAACVLEEARQNGTPSVDVEKLPVGSYRDLAFGPIPAGCTAACPCRSEVPDSHDPTKKAPICLDPARFRDLLQAEREAQQQERRRRFGVLWNEARDILQRQIASGEWQTVVPLLIQPLLLDHPTYDGSPGEWLDRTQEVVETLGIVLPWDDLLDCAPDEGTALPILKRTDPGQLLLLTACLLLAQETEQAIDYDIPTPALDFVLNRSNRPQPELLDDPECSELAVAQPTSMPAPPPESLAEEDDSSPATGNTPAELQPLAA
jgi:ParB family chromosome partitioning protein